MKILSIIPSLLFAVSAFSQTPVVNGGRLDHITNFPSSYIQPRNVDIWLPANYTPRKKYAVLFMHDGQMLFDSTHNWNHQEWMVDETMTSLLEQQRVRDCIVVGIANNGAYRHSEYYPEKTLALLPVNDRDSLIARDLKGKPQADAYLLFLVKELKPYIDQHYSTHTEAANTFIAGSSMGGLISMYAICEYPAVFGGAACLSTHWPGTLPAGKGAPAAAFLKYMSAHLPDPKTHRIYFDYGTATLDSLYKPYQLQADRILKKKGYSSRNWVTKEFIGDDHSEKSWSRRLGIPFYFLLGK